MFWNGSLKQKSNQIKSGRERTTRHTRDTTTSGVPGVSPWLPLGALYWINDETVCLIVSFGFVWPIGLPITNGPHGEGVVVALSTRPTRHCQAQLTQALLYIGLVHFSINDILGFANAFVFQPFAPKGPLCGSINFLSTTTSTPVTTTTTMPI